MILISCRKDFSNSRKFADKNTIRNYPFLPKLDKFDVLDEANLAAQMQGKHVLILIHGFRNPLQNVGSAYQQILKGLLDSGLVGDIGYDLVLGFTWPGFETPVGFFPAIPFANRSAGFFRSLQALAAGTDGFIDNLMLTAPAVDDECLEPGQEFHGALQHCRRCLVYHSEKDKTLKIGYRFADLDRALGLKGPEHPAIIKAKCPDVFVVDCKKVVASHSAYRNAGAYYEHWGRVLNATPLEQFEILEG
jgi:esterase/lipase superfamily enzyme